MATPSGKSEFGPTDLFELELMIRTEAEQIRKDWTKEMIIDPATGPAMRLYAEQQRRRADRLHRIGDILKGAQGEWPAVGPLLRRGYQRMVADYNKMMAETPAAETPGDAA